MLSVDTRDINSMRMLASTAGGGPAKIGRASCRERVLWVTGVQTCALPICKASDIPPNGMKSYDTLIGVKVLIANAGDAYYG